MVLLGGGGAGWGTRPPWRDNVRGVGYPGVQPMLLYIKSSRVEVTRTRTSVWEVPGLGEEPGHQGWTESLSENISGYCSWSRWVGVGEVQCLHGDCCPHTRSHTPDKAADRMDWGVALQVAQCVSAFFNQTLATSWLVRWLKQPLWDIVCCLIHAHFQKIFYSHNNFFYDSNITIYFEWQEISCLFTNKNII